MRACYEQFLPLKSCGGIEAGSPFTWFLCTNTRSCFAIFSAQYEGSLIHQSHPVLNRLPFQNDSMVESLLFEKNLSWPRAQEIRIEPSWWRSSLLIRNTLPWAATSWTLEAHQGSGGLQVEGAHHKWDCNFGNQNQIYTLSNKRKSKLLNHLLKKLKDRFLQYKSKLSQNMDMLNKLNLLIKLKAWNTQISTHNNLMHLL